MPNNNLETIIEHPAVEKIKAELAAIELDVTTSFTLADAVREGAQHTVQATGTWVEQESSCALGAGLLSAVARGYAV